LLIFIFFFTTFNGKAQSGTTDCDLFFADSLNISNSDDMIFNCTRNTFSASFCNWNLYDVSGITVTIELPVGINPVGLNGFVQTGQITRLLPGSAFIVFNIFTRVVSIPRNSCINLSIDAIGDNLNAGTILTNPNPFFVSIMPPPSLNGINCPQIRQEFKSDVFTYKLAGEITGDGSVYLTNNSALPRLICNPNVNAGDRYIVNGTLNLTAINGNGTTYCFNDAFVFLRPNARIIVEEGVICNIHSSAFRACENELWEGITVQSEGTLNVDNELQANANHPPRAEFFDAIHAVNALEGATVTINDTRFTDNRVGVRLHSNSNTIIDNNCIFRGTGTLKPSTVINTDDLPYAGIEADNGSFVSVFNSDFTNLANGIIADNSTVFTWNNDFNDMRNDQNLYPFQGFGVRVNNALGLRNVTSANCNYSNCQKTSIYTIGANVVTSGGNINNTPIGILAHKDEIFNVNGVNFNSVAQGINAVGNRRFRMDVNGNKFTNGTNVGIGLRFNSYPTLGLIHDNTINLSGTAAIKSEYATFGEGFHIEENPTIHFAGADAIRIIDGEQVKVRKNHDIKLVSGSRGIYLEGGKDNSAFCNIVDVNMGAEAAIRTNMSEKPLIKCNEVKFPLEGARGIRFDNTNVETDFSTNGMITKGATNSAFGLGLFLTDNARIGVQEWQGNCWTLSGATNENPFVTPSQFQVFTPPNPCFLPRFINAAAGWFNNNTPPDHKTQAVCNTGSCTLVPVLTNSEDIDVIFTDGILNMAGIQQNATWNMRRQYFNILKKDPLLLSQSNSSVQALMTQLTAGAMQGLFEVAEQMNTLYQGTSDQETTRIGLSEQINQLITLIQEINNNLATVTNNEDRLALLLERKTKVEELNGLYEQRDILDASINEFVENKIGNLIALNNAIETDNVLPADNEKLMNSFYLKAIAQENTLSSEEQNSLLAIALQCPYEGGNAVFRARILYEHLNGAMTFNDDCGADAPRIAKINPQLNVLAPNPASDYVLLRLPEHLHNETFELEVRNAQGMLVLSKTVNAIEQINTENLSAGFYTFSIRNKTNNILITVEKIILQK
jgi:hypothetical protein